MLRVRVGRRGELVASGSTAHAPRIFFSVCFKYIRSDCNYECAPNKVYVFDLDITLLWPLSEPSSDHCALTAARCREKDELASCVVFVIHGGCVRIVAVFMSSIVMITYSLPRNDIPRSIITDLLCQVDCGISPLWVFVEYSVMSCKLY